MLQLNARLHSNFVPEQNKLLIFWLNVRQRNFLLIRKFYIMFYNELTILIRVKLKIQHQHEEKYPPYVFMDLQ